MLTRRSLFGILAGAVAAPVVVRAGLLQTTALVAPTPSLTLEQLVQRYLEPAMRVMAEEMERDLFMYGTAFRRDTYNPATGKIVSERIAPTSAFLDFEAAA